jgi:multiple sugar transport system permease protein
VSEKTGLERSRTAKITQRVKRLVSRRSFLGRYWFVYALVLPAVLYRLFWTLWPLLQTTYLSFTDSNFIYGTSQFIGIQNYVDLLSDDQFLNSISFTLIYSASVVVGTLVAGMIIALLLNRIVVGKSFGRTVLLIPWVIPFVLAGIVWRIMGSNVGSPINDVLLRLGVIDQGVAWLAESIPAQIIVIVASIWKYTPFAALLLLAGLGTVPQELIEAAKLDGANAWQRFRHVTLPLITPVILVVLVFQTMDALRAFDIIYGLTKGGPGDSTQVLSYYAYQSMFFYGKSGYGSAQAIVMLVLTIAISGSLAALLYRRTSKEE